MAHLLVYPRFKAFNTDGTVLALGKVYTYITGTSTPKTTYTNAGAGTPNANPVILDANGEANIWGANDAQYRILIQDANGAQVGDPIDNVSPIQSPATLSANLDTNGHSIISTAGRDLTLTPAAGRKIILGPVAWVNADGTAGQVFKTNGAGVGSFVTPTADIVTDTTPQYGGNVDMNAFNLAFDNLTGILDGNGNKQLIFNTIASAVNWVEITNAATGNAPQIKTNGTDTNVDLKLAGLGTGVVKISNISYPTSPGTSGQVLGFNGTSVTFVNSGATTYVQRKVAEIATVSTLTTQIPSDDTIPQNTEGDEILTRAITPSSATSRLRITGIIPFFSLSAAGTLSAALFQDSTANALNANSRYVDDTNPNGPLIVTWEMAAGTTSSTTFKLRAGPSAAITAYTLANNAGTRRFGGIAKCYLYVEEVAP